MRLFNSLRRPQGGFMVDPGELQAEAARAVEDRFSRYIDRQLNIGFGRLTRKMEFLMAKLQDVLDVVAEQKTQIESLNSLADGIRAQVAQLLANANVDQTTQQLVDQVFDRLKENSGALAEAINENTPQATAGAVSGGPLLSDIKNDAPAGDAPSTDAPAAPADAQAEEAAKG